MMFRAMAMAATSIGRIQERFCGVIAISWLRVTRLSASDTLYLYDMSLSFTTAPEQHAASCQRHNSQREQKGYQIRRSGRRRRFGSRLWSGKLNRSRRRNRWRGHDGWLRNNVGKRGEFRRSDRRTCLGRNRFRSIIERCWRCHAVTALWSRRTFAQF
jgi:hypothetical protein